MLQRAADEPGSFHNFPGSFDETIFSQGTRTVNPNFWTKAKPNLGNDSIQYTLRGQIKSTAVYTSSSRGRRSAEGPS
jgi:hypothetical protein